MAYASQSDVDALTARYVVGASTTPTTAQALLIIDGVNDEIDAAISAAGYTAPVVSPAFFVDYLAFLNSIGAAAAQLRSMFPDATDGAEVSAYRFWYDWYIRGLKTLQDGTGIPTDTPTGAGTVSPSTYFTRNPDTEEDLGTIAEPMFKIGRVF